jgi:hypothetical protein
MGRLFHGKDEKSRARRAARIRKRIPEGKASPREVRWLHAYERFLGKTLTPAQEGAHVIDSGAAPSSVTSTGVAPGPETTSDGAAPFPPPPPLHVVVPPPPDAPTSGAVSSNPQGAPSSAGASASAAAPFSASEPPKPQSQPVDAQLIGAQLQIKDAIESMYVSIVGGWAREIEKKGGTPLPAAMIEFGGKCAGYLAEKYALTYFGGDSAAAFGAGIPVAWMWNEDRKLDAKKSHLTSVPPESAPAPANGQPNGATKSGPTHVVPPVEREEWSPPDDSGT